MRTFLTGSRCWIGLLLLVATALLSACAGSKQASCPPGDVACGTTSAASETAAQPDSLRAKFSLSLLVEDKMQDFDAVLFSVPGKRYRMELTGPLGVGVASLLWKEEGWHMVFPTEKLYLKGNGYMVGLLMNPSLPMVHIHQIAGFFQGQVLPAEYEIESSKDSASVKVFEAKEKTGRKFKYAEKDGQVIWLSRSGREGQEEVLYFNDYKTFEGVLAPSSISFKQDGKDFLSIRIKKITRGKSFSGGTWRLNIPNTYKPIDG